MSYQLHITRRKSWLDGNGPEISVEEWLAHVEGDADLRIDPALGEHVAVWSGTSRHEIAALEWRHGSIDSTHPDEALIRKMVAVATILSASVQGDEGERYDAEGKQLPLRRLGLVARMKNWISRFNPARIEPMDPLDLPFSVGDRVREPFGQRAVGVVVKIDPHAEHGAGLISVRFDSGRVTHWAMYSHPLERATEDAGAAGRDGGE